MTRREFLRAVAASGAVAGGVGFTASRARAAGARVVVIGGGFSGATAAKYIRMWAPEVDVTLVERQAEFISCPLSNRVLAGTAQLGDLTRGYGALGAKYGVRLIQDEVTAIDSAQRQVRLSRGAALAYDRVIVAPGIELIYDDLPGLRDAQAQASVLHAWKAGPQTLALRRQLEQMRDGGVYAICIPKAPYRCPPGPYERASQVAWYLKNHKPASKVLILDANEDLQSKKALFLQSWKEFYPGMIEYRPNSELVDVDAATLTAKLQFEDVKADVLNVVPPQKAGRIAEQTGLITVNKKWCGVNFLTFESAAQPNVHVLGDAIMAAPAMPKSGHMANQHGKVCAAAIVALLRGEAVNPEPMLTNTCYSFVTDQDVIHVASVHRYDAEKKTLVTVQGSGGVSAAPSRQEGAFAESWGRNMWADTLG